MGSARVAIEVEAHRLRVEASPLSSTFEEFNAQKEVTWQVQ